jgi:hypothetical protein
MKKLLFLPLVLIVSFCFAQDAKEIIGKPVKIGNLLVAQYDFQNRMDWVYAKAACAKLGKGWRLPTLDELYYLSLNKNRIGNFANDAYWSSSEDGNYAWSQIIMIGKEYSLNVGNRFRQGKYEHYCVRAVKSF